MNDAAEYSAKKTSILYCNKNTTYVEQQTGHHDPLID